MSIHMTYIQSQIFQILYSCSKIENFTSPFLRSETKLIIWVWCGPFFAIIRAAMDKIQKSFCELFHINGDIYDAKYEKRWVNIKWFVAYKQIFQVNICVQRLSPNMHLVPFSQLYGL